MTPPQIEAYVDAAAAALDLPLSPEHRPGVLQFFALAADFAEQLQAVPLDAHDDPAMVFVPVEPSPKVPG
ncbi:MAG: AtzG-like protein [Polaromonas sp.]|uniref:AtzG-like protein n=1 Tax=Polaromonas sp. TaxID=1869339 RepID=UPI003266AEE5